MAKQVCDLAAGKGISVSQSDEHLRKARTAVKNKSWSGNYDPTREHLNFEVVKEGIVKNIDKSKSIPTRIREILKARGILDPNIGLDKPRYRTVANFILGGSRGQMHRLAFGNQTVILDPGSDNSGITRMKDIEDWAVDMYNFMSKKYGEKNIAAFIVHLDETNPHIHCTILPITEKNKFSWKKVIAGADKFEYRDRMLKLHDELAEVNKKYQLERGDDISRTKAKHRTLEEYHQWEQKELRNKVAKQRITIKEQEDYIINISSDIKRAETKLKGLTTMISNLETIHAEKQLEIDKLQERLAAGGGDYNGLIEKIVNLKTELKNIEEKLDDKQDKLKKAKTEIASLILQKDDNEKINLDLQEKQESLVREIERTTLNLQDREMSNMESLALDHFRESRNSQIKKAEEYEAGLNENERKIIDNYNTAVFGGSPVDDMAAKTNEVVAVATALYFGYIDQAIKFATDHGGGGGGNLPSDWGKKDDEDDWAWRRRSFGMALHLMKPSKKRNLKR